MLTKPGEQVPWKGRDGRYVRSVCYAPVAHDGSGERDAMVRFCDR